jgi:hypothetical protein
LRKIDSYGINGIDLMIVEEDGQDQVYFTEINPRKTGQTQGIFLVHNLLGTTFPEQAWETHNDIHIPKNISLPEYITYLERKNIAFNPETKEGVVVVNFGPVPNGIVQIAAIGKNEYEVQEMVREAQMSDLKAV